MTTKHQPDTFAAAYGDAALERLSPMGEIERKMGIEPIENLLDERRRLVDQVAELRAKHGPWGAWDALRKVQLAQAKMKLRLSYRDAKVKASNDAIDDEAHADDEYVDFVRLTLTERTKWVKLEERITAIDFQINRAQMVGRYLTSEPK